MSCSSSEAQASGGARRRCQWLCSETGGARACFQSPSVSGALDTVGLCPIRSSPSGIRCRAGPARLTGNFLGLTVADSLPCGSVADADAEPKTGPDVSPESGTALDADAAPLLAEKSVSNKPSSSAMAALLRLYEGFHHLSYFSRPQLRRFSV